MLTVAGQNRAERPGGDPALVYHPASRFAHPDQVLYDPLLSRDDKRVILSAWASDACAVASSPGLRQPPGAPHPVPLDDILTALARIDGSPRPGGTAMRAPPRRRVLRAFQARAGHATRRYLERHIFRVPASADSVRVA